MGGGLLAYKLCRRCPTYVGTGAAYAPGVAHDAATLSVATQGAPLSHGRPASLSEKLNAHGFIAGPGTPGVFCCLLLCLPFGLFFGLHRSHTVNQALPDHAIVMRA